MKSWKTSVSATLVAVIMVLSQISAAIDSDEKTIPDWNQVIEAVLIIYWGWNTRDKDVTSEQEGIK